MRNSKIILIGFMTMLLMAVCCGRRSHDPRLERIWEYVSDEPREAMVALDSIEAAKLSDSDRAFYNLLSIKAKDKADIHHTSDSLILTVMDYYFHNENDALYSEALYYGGRVYYDLGDYPTSLRYFQDALDLLPKDTPNIRLRGNVLSQAGGLLNELGLYRDAIPYIEGVLEINQELNDTINLARDYNLLGAIYMHITQYNRALEYTKLSEKWARFVSKNLVVEAKLYQAAVSYYNKDIKSALDIIRPISHISDSIPRITMLSYASKIYLEAGILDTAYIYAHELALSRSPYNRKTGYMVMLSPELRHLLPKDSMDFFYADYKQAIEEHFIHQEDNLSLLQNSMYNYRLHDRRRQEAEKSEERKVIYVISLIAVVSILVAILLYMSLKHKSRLVELHEALAKLEFIEEVMKRQSEESIDKSNAKLGADTNTEASEPSQLIKDEKSLKNELRKKCKLIRDDSESYDISPRILSSRPYMRLQSLLNSHSPIPNESNIFVELESVFAECYPDFKTHLQLLADGNLKEEDLKLALLIRCGFMPKQLSILLGRSNSTITYRRKKLSVKLLGEDLDVETIDSVVRSL